MHVHPPFLAAGQRPLPALRPLLLLPALALLLLLALAPAPARAQAAARPNYRLELRTGAVVPPTNVEEFMASATPPDIQGGVYYRVVQFWTPLTRERRGRLEQAWAVKLLHYLPHNAWLVAFPASFNRYLLNGYGVRSVVKLEAEAKLAPALRTAGNLPAHAVTGAEVRLLVQVFETAAAATVRAALEAAGATEIAYDSAQHQATVRVPLARLRAVAGQPLVLAVEPVPAPPQKEDRPGRSNHRVNYLNADYPLGRHADGTGVRIALGDDGEIGPHIDYQGRTDQTSVLGTNDGDHGDHVAGILIGAGNLDPRQRGMAPGAELKVYSPFVNINSAPADYTPFGIRLTSTSYGDGCNTGYTNFARTVDQQTRQFPALLHVFSAGNSGTVNCGFLAGWGNITGGNKVGKNVLAVGSLDYQDQLAASSSRGPAKDGRIKPDLCAVGVDVNSTLPGANGLGNQYGLNSGTSMACPGVAGTAAALYHRYRQLHAGLDPVAGLIKGALLASADDLGRPGPDFEYGYGRLNARRATELLETGAYYADSVAQGEVRTWPLTVPAGTRELRLLTYWTDYESAVVSSRALVNDLDFSLLAPDSTVYRPWVLDPRRVLSAMTAPAVRARDSLNNVEQITLVAPAPGTYTLRVAGTQVPQGAQPFFLFRELATDSLTVTYPLGGESFAPGDAETVRWDAVGTAGVFEVSVSADNGLTWQVLAANVAATRRSFNWTPPAARAGQQLRLRVRRGTHVGQSAAPFSVLAPPANLRVLKVCPDSTTVAWDAVPGATRYDVFRLGTKYMDSVGTTAALRCTLGGIGPTTDEWLSVRAVVGTAAGAAGATSRRANALRRLPGTVNCVVALDATAVALLAPTPGVNVTCGAGAAVPVTLQLRNASATAVAGLRVFYRVGTGAVQTDSLPGPLAAGALLTHTFSTPASLPTGAVSLVAWVRLPGDGNPFNDTVRTTVAQVAGTLAALPHRATLDTWSRCGATTNCGATTCPLADGWVNVPNGAGGGGGDDIDWRVYNGATPSADTGPDVDHTLGTSQGRYLYLEASNCVQQTAVLLSPCFDLRGTRQPEFSGFYHAYGADMGSLHVDVLPDSGAAVLDAIPAITGNQGNQWLPFTVPLSGYRTRTVTIRLRGVTGADFASDLALDDLGLRDLQPTGRPVAGPAAQLAADLALVPNPTTGRAHLTRPTGTAGPLTLHLLDARGVVVWRGQLPGLTTTLELGAVPPGTYALRVRSERAGVVVKRLVKLGE